MLADVAEQTKRAFGEQNRRRHIDLHFSTKFQPAVVFEPAWKEIYRLLLWIDLTTGLAHCYESDKCQPGRPWYARSLAFHKWLSDEFGVSPVMLEAHIDVLFRAALKDLATVRVAAQDALRVVASSQLAVYEGVEMPLPPPGGFRGQVSQLLQAKLGPSGAVLVNDITELLDAKENERRRKNLVGEGFEDALAAILRRRPDVMSRYDILVRPPLHEIPGFHVARGQDKVRKVDLVLIRQADGSRLLVTCKWSIRSDREEQLASDFESYVKLENSGAPFQYVLVTNEFDPARLAAACERVSSNSHIFTRVVHVNVDGLMAAYFAPIRASGRSRGGLDRSLGHIESERLESLDAWIESL